MGLWGMRGTLHLLHLAVVEWFGAGNAYFFFFIFEMESRSVTQARVQRLTATSASRLQGVAGITGTCHHAQLIFVFLVQTGSDYDGQAGLELLTSGAPRT